MLNIIIYQVYKKQKYPVVDKDVQMMYALLDVLYFYQDIIGDYPEYGEDFYYNADANQYQFDLDTERGKYFANLLDKVLKTNLNENPFINVVMGNLVEQNWLEFTNECVPELRKEINDYVKKTEIKQDLQNFKDKNDHWRELLAIEKK